MSWTLLDKLIKNPMFAETTHCYIKAIGDELKVKIKRGDLFSVKDEIEVVTTYPYCWDAIKLAEKAFTTDTMECYMSYFSRDEEAKNYKYRFKFRLKIIK